MDVVGGMVNWGLINNLVYVFVHMCTTSTHLSALQSVRVNDGCT